MDDSEAKFLKRKVKAGRLDIHPSENVIIVNYEVEAVILTDTGAPMIADAKRCQKNIVVRSLSESTDVYALAQNIIDRCKLISPQKIDELVRLLQYLQTRAQDEEFAASVANAKKSKQGSLLNHGDSYGNAKIGDIDEYLELLYESTSEKIKGTALILQVAQNPDNLEEMIQNESVLGALARVLREDGLKPLDQDDGVDTMELATNIIHIFFILSSFTEFHDFLKQYKIGALCLKIVAQEMKRYDNWQIMVKKKMKKYAKKKPQEAERIMEQFNDNCFKQESLLYVAIHLLLNLAEDTRVQIKMKNKNIVTSLITLLERDNVEFLILIVNFLKKLSIFAENKDEMKEQDITKRLVRLIYSPHNVLAHATLGLLLNLSFDKDLRTRVVELGLLGRLIEILQSQEAPFRGVVSILYNLTIDEVNRAAFGQTECIRLLMGEVIAAHGEERPSMEIVALFVNLAMDIECAKMMCEDDGLRALVGGALDGNDPLLLKIVRNISRHPGEIKMNFLELIDPLASATVSNPSDEMLVELLGVFGNLNIPDFDFHHLVVEYEMLDFIIEGLLPAAVDDDVVLQLIIVVGTILADENCAGLIARSGIVQNLMELLAARQEDDEMVLQIVFVFYKLLYYAASRKLIMTHPKTIAYLIDLMYDKNQEIKRVCNAALSIVMQYDDDWAVKIRDRRFEAHNEEWINAMQGDFGGVGYGMQEGYDNYEGYADDVYDTNELDRYGAHGDYYDSQDDEELDLDAGFYGIDRGSL